MVVVILTALQLYLVVGIVFTAIVDLSIRCTKCGTPFTLLEAFGTVIAWPTILSSIINR
jgi:hypothetical protein